MAYDRFSLLPSHTLYIAGEIFIRCYLRLNILWLFDPNKKEIVIAYFCQGTKGVKLHITLISDIYNQSF